MFTDVYLQTTNPQLKWSDFFRVGLQGKIMASVLFHTMVYVLFSNLVSWVFWGNPLSKAVNIRLSLSLLVIMAVGFIARFWHVKEIYRAYGENVQKTRAHLDRLYIGWIFIS